MLKEGTITSIKYFISYWAHPYLKNGFINSDVMNLYSDIYNAENAKSLLHTITEIIPGEYHSIKIKILKDEN